MSIKKIAIISVAVIVAAIISINIYTYFWETQIGTDVTMRVTEITVDQRGDTVVMGMISDNHRFSMAGNFIGDGLTVGEKYHFVCDRKLDCTYEPVK